MGKRGPGPSAGDRCTKPQTESLASWQASKRADTVTAQSVLSFPLDPLLLPFPWRKRSRQVSLESNTLSAPSVGEELRDRRAERECDAGLRARAGSGEALLNGEAGEDRFPVQSGLGMS